MRWIVLTTLLLMGCSELTAPQAEQRASSKAAAVTTTTQAAKPEAAKPEAPTLKEEEKSWITASHILIAYKGARRARQEVTRTKEQAKQFAEQLLARLKKGEDFAKLAEEHSDDPSAKGRGGSLGNFERHSMVKPFADAAFALEVGQISEVVETIFGYHIIKRTK